MNEVEWKSCVSIIASIGWLCVSGYPLCSFYSSYIQHNMGYCRVTAIPSQFNPLKTLKKHGSSTNYICPKTSAVADTTFIDFFDASHSKESTKIGYIVGIMIGTVSKGNKFYPLSWASSTRKHKTVDGMNFLCIVCIAQDFEPNLHLQLKFLQQVRLSMRS